MGDECCDPVVLDEKIVGTLTQACDDMDVLLVDKVPRLLGQCVSIIRLLKTALIMKDKEIADLKIDLHACLKRLEDE